jgi:F0F1-type ATP synthase membrane subunit b/b'
MNVKRFLAVLLAVYTLGGVVIIALWGPPGYTRAYMDRYEHEHETYLEIIKSKEYKLYSQRPHLHPLPDETYAFLDSYTANADFIAENHRMHRYHLAFQFFNAAALIVLVTPLARKPLLNFLDGQIAQVRERIDKTERASRSAAELKKAAQARYDEIPAQADTIRTQAKAHLASELEAMEIRTQRALAHLDEEAELRKALEERRGRMTIKRELVNAALSQFAEQYRAAITDEKEEGRLAEFTASLEKAP